MIKLLSTFLLAGASSWALMGADCRQFLAGRTLSCPSEAGSKIRCATPSPLIPGILALKHTAERTSLRCRGTCGGLTQRVVCRPALHNKTSSSFKGRVLGVDADIAMPDIVEQRRTLGHLSDDFYVSPRFMERFGTGVLLTLTGSLPLRHLCASLVMTCSPHPSFAQRSSSRKTGSGPTASGVAVLF